MLAYVAHRRAQRRVSPTTLSLIIGGHAVALALLVTAKMDIPILPKGKDMEVINVKLPPPPPVPDPKPSNEPLIKQPSQSVIDRPTPILPAPIEPMVIDSGPATTTLDPSIGTVIDTPIVSEPVIPPKAAAVRVAARPVTPASELRPPYPDSKRRTEEEAVLRLRLEIDARGRVVAVSPIGSADLAFLEAARTHLLRHWRYRPATEDGRAVSSSLVITLRFELEDA